MPVIINNEDTICAVITPAGVGAVSLIRVSGPDAFKITGRFFKGGSDLEKENSHTIHYGKFSGVDGEVIDDVLLYLFKGPNSYTGENVIEIGTHGSPYIVQEILRTLYESGVRGAEPGEFTRRAFLNGKIDLSQAEAVIDVINSSSAASLRGARNQLDGHLSSKIKELREWLLNSSSFLELELDFAEEDIEFVQYNELKERIRKVTGEIDGLLGSYNYGRILREGVNLVIAGRPNAGKSSLLNYLLKESRAIVSHIPGTTRDIIREELSINGVLYKIFDTAGIRTGTDEIEKEGILRSHDALKEADVVLLLFDDELPEVDVEAEKVIKVFNKIDIKECPGMEADVKISALTGQGIKELITLIEEKVFGSKGYTERNVVVANLRHRECLRKTNECLGRAVSAIDDGLTGEFISFDLREAENSLSEIIGEISTDDILNNIFSKFCIGK